MNNVVLFKNYDSELCWKKGKKWNVDALKNSTFMMWNKFFIYYVH